MKEFAEKEAAKEFARIIVLAILPVLMSSLEASSFDWRTTLVAVAIAVLRAVDRYIHTDMSTDRRGLLPF